MEGMKNAIMISSFVLPCVDTSMEDSSISSSEPSLVVQHISFFHFTDEGNPFCRAAEQQMQRRRRFHEHENGKLVRKRKLHYFHTISHSPILFAEGTWLPFLLRPATMQLLFSLFPTAERKHAGNEIYVLDIYELKYEACARRGIFFFALATRPTEEIPMKNGEIFFFCRCAKARKKEKNKLKIRFFTSENKKT